uniref:Uncharacterized protein n=1 Tax=Arundo donax TaxID=35708 RepID=A0A0A9GV69_ARUDO
MSEWRWEEGMEESAHSLV